MALLTQILSFFRGTRATLNNPSTSITQGIDDLVGGNPNASIKATEETIFALTAMFRAVSILSGVLASMGCCVYRLSDDETATKLRTHPVSRLLRRSPNPYISAYDFFQIMVTQLVAYGNFYARIDRDREARPRAITILNPSSVSTDIVGRASLVYVYNNPDGTQVRYPYDRILHISGLSNGSVQGLDIVKLFKSVIEAGLTNQEYINRFFQNGTQLSGVVSVPQALTQDAYQRMRSSWSAAYSGPNKAGATAILEGGATYQRVGLSPTDASFDTTRSAIIADVSRITGVPEFLLGDLGRATFNNIEHLGQLFVTYTVMPLSANIQAELARKLLLESEFDDHEIRFDFAALLRADTVGRAALIDAMMKWGILNRDEARKLEGLGPIPNGSGQAYYIPINMRDPVTEPFTEAAAASGAQNTPQDDTNQ